MGFIGAQELIVILLIVILLFGAKKIPELAKGLGTGIKEFKKASKEAAQEPDEIARQEEKKETR
jgi:sec-independent protein translocase protein TatA